VKHAGVRRGEIWWADLPDPRGSEPGSRRPVLIIQADSFNRSRIGTVVAAALTSNLRLAAAPGNVLLRGGASGLKRDSVVNVSQILVVDKVELSSRVGVLRPEMQRKVDEGLRLVLDL
jgi:mRNA interferase MazF